MCVRPTDIKPDLRDLWFRKDTEVRHLQLSTFLALLELKEYAEVLDTLEVPLVAVVCLVTYIVLQVRHKQAEHRITIYIYLLFDQ